MMFATSVQQELSSKMIDFKNAFVQSSLPEPIFLEVPPGGYANLDGFRGKVFKVKKSLYGDRRAPRLWYDHCRTTLESERYNFKVDDLVDSCLFLRPGLAIILYVDDAILISKDSSEASHKQSKSSK